MFKHLKHPGNPARQQFHSVRSVPGASALARCLAVAVLGLSLAACRHTASGGGAASDLGAPDPSPAPEAPAPDEPPEAGEAAVTLSWTAPALSADETPCTDLAGFKIYDGSRTGAYTWVTDVGRVTTFTTDPLPAGTYYFAVTAYDWSGNESEVSDEVMATISEDSEVQVLAYSR
ncbi:MAG: fibronectin type III domain-containing protein [Planctomycetes bacterium]|nr:fibronectin type III domain-containing protein [Planctomycetota bacterium]